MKRTEINRRLVLRGAGGVALGLPFLASLQKSVFAQPTANRQPRFVALGSPHGGVLEPSMFPKAETLTETARLFPGHDIRRGALVRTVEGNDALLSKVLRAPATALTDKLVKKMNVIQGLDVPFFISHNTGAHLGNYARNDGNGDDGKEVNKYPMVTIDQLMAWSPGFYKDIAAVKERVLSVGPSNGFSYVWSNPTARTGAIQELKSARTVGGYFDRVFVPSSMMATPVAARKPIVDRVLEDYKLLRNGNRRLSAGDRQRLDDHMSRISELQRRIGGGPVSRPVSCNSVKKPANFEPGMDKKLMYQLYNDLIVAAFMCGTSRLAVIAAYDHFVSYPAEGWHNDIAHMWSNAGPQQMLLDSNRTFFEWAFLDLITKLDVEEMPGSTFLDNTLVAWTQESGMQTHDAINIPVVTAGSAGGFLNTGQHLDYRNLQIRFTGGPPMGMPQLYHGLTWNRWLGTVLQTMGIPKSEYARPGMTGYGYPFIGKGFGPRYVSGVVDSADEILPFLKA